MHDDTKPEPDSVSALAAAGGKARAQSLSTRRRADIARHAASARWSTKATHMGEITLGDKHIPCAVLEDGTRVLTQTELMLALGRSTSPMGMRETGSEHIPAILRGKALKPYISNELLEASKPIRFTPLSGGNAIGYRAEVVTQICDVYLAARADGKLPHNQQHIAKHAEILIRALAQVAIIALVDEATGYQAARDKDALAKILQAFVAKELRKWVRTFPTDYYRELFRLRGWRFPRLPEGQQKRPILVGKLTNDVVYARLAPGVRQELHRLTPRDDKGRLKQKLFQRLTEDMGHPRLREHLASVIALMKASDDWDHFMKSLNRALPKYKDLPLLAEIERMEST